jgi:threonine-phosphate decarboxylase
MIHGGYIYDHDIAMDFSVNLNPLPIPDSVKDAMYQALSSVSCYPDPTQTSVRQSLAGLHTVSLAQILGGNGASELLFAIVSMLRPKKALLIQPGFFGYEHALSSVGCRISNYRLKEEDGFALTDDLIPYLEEKPDILFLTNPNNPTGKLIETDLLDRILSLCKAYRITVVLDECFYEMSSHPMDSKTRYRDMLAAYPNLYILKAFTKLFRIPGIRSGYVLGQEENIKALRQHLPEWNMSVIAQNTAVACADCLLTTDYLLQTRRIIEEQRHFLQSKLTALGFTVYDSQSSFLLLRSQRDLYKELLSRNVLIRDCSNFHGLSKGYYRIAVKDEKSNQALLNLLSLS